RPGVVAAGRHVQRGAQHVHGVFIAHGFHALKSLPDGAAMMPRVFFRMSRCCARWRTSRRSRRFSSSSCGTERCPGPVAGSAASFFFHCFRLCVLMPSSAAMAATDLPPWSHSSTAERLKLSSYRLYLRGSLFSVFMVSCISSHNHPTLVHQFEARPEYIFERYGLCVCYCSG